VTRGRLCADSVRFRVRLAARAQDKLAHLVRAAATHFRHFLVCLGDELLSLRLCQAIEPVDFLRESETRLNARQAQFDQTRELTK
jgi:hypothetical protein